MNKVYNSLVASISKFLTNIFNSDGYRLNDGAAMRFDAYFNFDDKLLISNCDQMFKILLDINENNITETYDRMIKLDFSNNWLQFWLIFIYCTKIRTQLVDFYERLFEMMHRSLAAEYFIGNKKLLVDFSFFCHCFGFMNILISKKIINPEDLNFNDSRFNEFFETTHDWKIRFKVKSNDMIASAIRKDDLDFLKENVDDPLIVIKDREYEQITMLKTASMAEYAAFHGSIKCLKYLKEIGDSSNCINYAIAGGNPEVIEIVEPHEEIDFYSVSLAIKFHHYDIFEWLSDKYSKESHNDWINDKKHKYLFFHKYQSDTLILDERAFKSRNNYNITNLNRINNLNKANINKYSPKRQKVQFQSNQFQPKRSDCSNKVDVATSIGENMIDLLNIYREENQKLNEKLKSSKYIKKKIDPKTFCLAVISEGGRYSQIAAIMNKLDIDIPSEREFFYVQKRIEFNVTNFVRLDMFKWSLMLDSESSIAFDAAWMTRRNSRGAFSAFIELKSYKIIDYEWLFKGINYQGTSQHMEAEMFERMGERWKNDKRIKTLVHDNDTHTRNSLENKLHWEIDEKVDSNHLCNCFKRFIKSYVKKDYKETFKHISQNIIDFFIILMHDTQLTCIEKKEQWNNMIQHLSGNHEKCRHAEKSSKEKWEHSNDKQHCKILLEFIQATIKYFDKCDPLLTTQVCESLNSLKAKICEKQIAYSCSFPLRMAFVVMKWNNPELYYIELIKYLGLDQLTKKQEHYIIRKREDYEKQSKNRKSEEYKKNRSKLRKKSRTKGKEQTGDHKYAEEEKDEDFKKKLSFINDEEIPSYYLESSEDSFETEQTTEENQNYEEEEDIQDTDSSNSEMNYFGDDVNSSEIEDIFNKADSLEEEKCDDKIEGIDIKNFHPTNIGLIRPGVSCFIISILQSIINQKTSINFIYDEDLVTSVYSDPISFPVLNSFFIFLTHYINAQKAISPRPILSIFYKNQMDDAHGFLMQFLDNIESELISFDNFKSYINFKYSWVLTNKDEQNQYSRFYTIDLPEDDLEINLVDKFGEIIENVNYYPERLTFMINRSNDGYKYIKKNIVRLEENITLGGKNYNLSGIITFDIKALHYKYVRVNNKEVIVFDDSYCYQVTNNIKYDIILSQSYLVFYDLVNTA